MSSGTPAHDSDHTAGDPTSHNISAGEIKAKDGELQARTQGSSSESRERSPSNPTAENSNGDIIQKPEAQAQSTLVSPEKPSKKRSLLSVPSRASSNVKPEQSPSSTASGTAQGLDEPSNPERRSSRRGLIGRRREGSRASSRHSKSAQKDAKREPVAEAPSTVLSGKQKPEKKGGRGLLSFLNCCTGPDGTEAVLPPTKKELPRDIRPVSEPEKVGNSTTEPNVVNASHGNTEKTPGTEPEGHSSEKAPKQIMKGSDVPARSRSFSKEKSQQPPLPSTSPTSISEKQNQQLPPLPSSPPNVLARQNGSQNGQEANDQVLPTSDKAPTNAESEALPQEPQSDIEMPDAPPVDLQRDQEPPTVSTQSEDPKSKSDLPPPPPATVPRDTANVPAQAPPPPHASQENQQWLLPPLQAPLKGRKCLVLDLDETLVHSSFKILNQADFTIPVEIEGQYHNVYVIKRPGVDQFMKRIGELYEVVVFTASVSKYGDPLLDQLDIHHVVHHRLFRESCYNHQGNYVKDLSQVGRDLRETIIIDNSPTSYIFHPQHAVPISSWFSDAHDNELLDLIPVLEDLAGSQVRDVSLVLDVAL
ncbi:MAG: hypothetical protein Q9160_000532 [Pyrenula sp. 1 TL-2023]